MNVPGETAAQLSTPFSFAAEARRTYSLSIDYRLVPAQASSPEIHQPDSVVEVNAALHVFSPGVARVFAVDAPTLVATDAAQKPTLRIGVVNLPERPMRRKKEMRRNSPGCPWREHRVTPPTDGRGQRTGAGA